MKDQNPEKVNIEESFDEVFGKSEKPSLSSDNESVSPSEPSDAGKKGFFSEAYKVPRRIFLGLVLVGTLFLLGFMISVSFDLPPMEVIENPKSDLSTQLISADGVVLQKYYSRENRVNVSLDEISPYVTQGLIATEDLRFARHSGIDPKSFFTILYELLTSGEVRGGSTITMQLVRNLYAEVGRESLYIRKPKEYLVSAYLERYFTKDEILAAYLNTVNIYGTSYGIETTANRLFDKSAKELNVEESALVIGMLKGQGDYNPFRYPERTQTRRNTVINLMRDHGVLKDFTPEQVDSIKEIPLDASLVDQEELHVKGPAPYFREHVRQYLRKWCQENGYDLYRDGLRVYTTIDSRMQNHAEAAVRKHLKALQNDFDKVEKRGKRSFDRHPGLINDLKKQSARYRNALKAGKSQAEIDREFREKIDMTVFTWDGPKEVKMSPLDSIGYYARFLETGLMAIDPTNGHVKAWVGGNDFKYFQYDHVYQGKRQVGSTFKPFVYGAAIESGYPVCYEFLNQPVTIQLPDGNVWQPDNSDNDFGAKITMRTALANSVNLVTAQLIDKITPKTVASFAHKMGIESELDEVHSLALGTTDLSVYEMVKAYSTFANMGTRTEPIFITRIEDKGGNLIVEFKPEVKEVLNPADAYKLVQLLRDVVDQGTARRLRFRYKLKNQIGGKTGTTQNQSDGWFMGLTPDLVAGVWVGHSDRRMHFSSIRYGQGANMALPIWAEFMKGVYGDKEIKLPQDPFPVPRGFNEDLSCRTAESETDDPDADTGPRPDDLDGF
jgi:penicillin-binding protein 1A